jgi:hypothetical protein
MALEGTIKDFGLPDIFQLIGLQRKTGILTLKTDKDQVTVTFENGMVVNADSALKRIEDRLGNVLVKQGKITKEQLEEALHTQRATLQRLGYVLTSGSYITQEDLKQAIQVQVSQMVFRVFRWRDGEYHFAPTDSVDFDRENFTPMSADYILMEGIRMVDEWPIIEKKIPSFDLVFRQVVDPSNIQPEGAEGAPDGNKVRLTGDEEKVYRRVDGHRTVQGVIDAAGLSEFDVCRVLFDLLNRNIVAPVGKGEARETEAFRPQTPVSSAPGYAALAVVVLLAVAGTAFRARAPLAASGSSSWLADASQRLRSGLAEVRMERIDEAILAHRLATGMLPERLDDLVRRGLVDPGWLRDPWGNSFVYSVTGDGYQLNRAEGSPGAGAPLQRSLPLIDSPSRP